MNRGYLHTVILLLFCISHYSRPSSPEQRADLIIFSYNRPLQLHTLLSSLETYVSNISTIYVLCRMSDHAYEQAYAQVFEEFPQVVVLKQGNEPKKDFKPLLLQAFDTASSEYILFSTDDLMVKDYVDIRTCIHALARTQAYGFYLRLGHTITYSYNQNIPLTLPPFSQPEPGIYAWNFSDGKSYWAYPNSVDMVLFKKSTIAQELHTPSYHSPNILESRWARRADTTGKGLCFKTTKAFNLPLNLVQEDWYNKHEASFSAQQLLDIWNQGLMMNRMPFHQVANASATMAYTPKFIARPPVHLPEKKITVIIPSYNNAPYFKANLESVLQQEYRNYHIIYINDASTDDTGALVQQYIEQHQLQDKITLINNAYNRKALANIYRALHACNPHDLIVELDGDDALAHPRVLHTINRLFSTYDIWFAYAQYKNVPEHKALEHKISPIGYAKPTPPELIQSASIRGKWLWSGLRAFYAWLAQQVKLEDLLLPQAPYQGKFFPTSKDAALCYPMLEMAREKHMFIPDILLMRNVDTPINDFKIARQLQQHCGAFLKTIPPYAHLTQKSINHQIADPYCPLPCADIIIFATHPHQLENYLLSLHIFSADVRAVTVLYDAQNADYAPLIAAHPTITFIPCDDTTRMQTCARVVQHSTEYVLLTHNTHHLKKPILFTTCIQDLERTKANTLYMTMHAASLGSPAHLHTLPCEQINDDIYACKCSCVAPSVHHLNAGLYKKTELIAALHALEHHTSDHLFATYYAMQAKKGSVALFFQEPMVNL